MTSADLASPAARAEAARLLSETVARSAPGTLDAGEQRAIERAATLAFELDLLGLQLATRFSRGDPEAPDLAMFRAHLVMTHELRATRDLIGSRSTEYFDGVLEGAAVLADSVLRFVPERGQA